MPTTLPQSAKRSRVQNRPAGPPFFTDDRCRSGASNRAFFALVFDPALCVTAPSQEGGRLFVTRILHAAQAARPAPPRSSESSSTIRILRVFVIPRPQDRQPAGTALARNRASGRKRASRFAPGR